MRFDNLRIGWGVTGSHCTLEQAFTAAGGLAAEGAELVPILSASVTTTTTRFGAPEKWLGRLKAMGLGPPITTIAQAEPIGPKKLLDLLVIVPCTGNTVAKLAAGITDTPVLMAAKAHLRNEGPLVIAIATNDGLGANAKNIGQLLAMKNVFWVPFGQDDPVHKTKSLGADLSRLGDAAAAALDRRQLQPLLIQY